MTKELNTKNLTGVRAKLSAYKTGNTGTEEVTLKKSGIVCTVPNFISHGIWMKAQRIGKGDLPKSQAAFVCETVLFEGEKLTMTDLAELVPSADSLQLINTIFGDDDEKSKTDGDDAGDAGNEQAA